MNRRGVIDPAIGGRSHERTKIAVRLRQPLVDGFGRHLDFATILPHDLMFHDVRMRARLVSQDPVQLQVLRKSGQVTTRGTRRGRE